MRILIVSINVASWGGSEELWKELAEKALEEGHEVMVSVFEHQGSNQNLIQLVELGALLHQRPLPSYFKNQSFFRRALSELKFRLGTDKVALDWLRVQAWRPESVVISSGETFDHYLNERSFLISYSRKNRIPHYFISQRNWEWGMDVDQDFRDSKKRLFESFDAVFFVSYQNYKMACMQLAGDIHKARIIQNPLKVDSNEELLFPKSSTLKMAYVARFQTVIKGQDLFLQALSDPDLRQFEFELTFFGSGPDEVYIRELVSYYGLEGKVFFGGHVADIREIWESHQLLVLCSLAEGTPLSLIEAMACGRTALVTQVGDSAIWLSDLGYVAESNRVEAIQNTLFEALKNSQNWEEQGRACKNRIRSHRNPDEVVSLLECIVGERDWSTTGLDPEVFRLKMKTEN
ncbi:MAG: glycosyltransferase involved in cell wall biosynthesis [Algoriphagus sp.]|jgi:glycosyltransferase involved in cell wall biosynthesis